MLIKVEQCSQYIMCKKLLIKHLYDMKTKQNRYMHKKKKVERIFTRIWPPPLPWLAVNLHNKKLKFLKLKEFFKFMLYTDFTYLVTRKLTRTPGSVASLHCFSGEHLWLRLLKWSLCPYRGGESLGPKGNTILETSILYFHVKGKLSTDLH